MRRMVQLLLLAALLAGCGRPAQPPPSGGLRVIAMAPSTAEILYALGLSNAVVGVSRFTLYPPEAAAKPVVGGLYDPNWEQIVSLRPDAVIGLSTQKEIADRLRRLGIRFVGVSHERTGDIVQAVLTVGETCGAAEAAQALAARLRREMAEACPPPPARRPRVLVCVGHDAARTKMYVAARGTLYDELIGLAGGTNACASAAGTYPEISPEGLAAMNPERIIDILPPGSRPAPGFWQPWRAVALTNDYASIPGPRFVLLLRDIAAALHDE